MLIRTALSVGRHYLRADLTPENSSSGKESPPGNDLVSLSSEYVRLIVLRKWPIRLTLPPLTVVSQLCHWVLHNMTLRCGCSWGLFLFRIQRNKIAGVIHVDQDAEVRPVSGHDVELGHG